MNQYPNQDIPMPSDMDAPVPTPDSSSFDDPWRMADEAIPQRDLLAGLNPPQREAVLHDEGPMLILAGAGSGKTRVITHRIAYLIQERGVKPWSILAITFTNKAAQEMKHRVEGLIGPASQQMWIGTFHSMMARVLRRFADSLGYSSSFTIADTDDQERMLKQIIRQLNLDEKMFPPRQVSAAISGAKNKMILPSAFSAQAGSDYRQGKIAQIYTMYQAAMQQGNSMDFDDILVNAVRLFREHPAVLDLYQQRFKYIMVDEYQDTNGAQYQLVSLLAKAHQNLCVVGDDDQSIYSFRGANIQNILDFEKDFPNTKVVKLEQNYRSTGHVLNAANAVISNNEGRKSKKLWTDQKPGPKITAFQAEHQGEEARYIAGEITRMLQNNRIKHVGEVAILYRMNVLSRGLEAALREQAIPYRIYGGLRFYDRKEIKDVLAYLRVISSEDDDLALTRIINVPRRGIGDATIETLRSLAAAHGTSMFRIAASCDDYPELSRARVALGGFVQTIETMRERMQVGDDHLATFIEYVQDYSGLVQDIIDQQERGKEETVDRIENLRELLSDAVEFEENPERDLWDFSDEELKVAGLLVEEADRSVHDEDEISVSDEAVTPELSLHELLNQFLEKAALYASNDDLDNSEHAVRLMTIHSAKGLEYKVVFVAGFDEGLFPGIRSMDTPEQMEEERRLAYVAITRAEEKLYLTTARSRLIFGRTSRYIPSRFLSEIPQETLQLIGGASANTQTTTESNTNQRGHRTMGVTQGTVQHSNHTQAKPWQSAVRAMQTNKNKVKEPAKPTLNVQDIQKGDRVQHPRFGEGTIVQIEAVAGDAIVKITFDGSGTKRLLLNSAGLSKV